MIVKSNCVKLALGVVLAVACLAIAGCASTFGSWDEGYMDHGVYVIGNKTPDEAKKESFDVLTEKEKQKRKKQRVAIERYAHILADKGDAGTGADSTAYLTDDGAFDGVKVGCTVTVKVYNLEKEFEREEIVKVCDDK